MYASPFLGIFIKNLDKIVNVKIKNKGDFYEGFFKNREC